VLHVFCGSCDRRVEEAVGLLDGKTLVIGASNDMKCDFQYAAHFLKIPVEVASFVDNDNNTASDLE
jgi:hypothetical protein